MQLAKLPPPIEAPRSSLHNLCATFERDLKEWISGEFDKKTFVVKLGEADKEFLKDIKCSIARFGLADRDEEMAGVMAKTANDFLFENKGTLLITQFIDMSRRYASAGDPPSSQSQP